MVPGGGSVQLGKLIDEHGAALAHDLQYLGIDLRDLWRDGTSLTPRWVLMLAGQLSSDSALWASQRGGQKWRAWPIGNQLLAASVNQLAAANAQRAGKRPKPVVTLPKDKPARRARVVTVAEIAAQQRRESGR